MLTRAIGADSWVSLAKRRMEMQDHVDEQKWLMCLNIDSASNLAEQEQGNTG